MLRETLPDNQTKLFSTLSEMLNPRHPLFALSDKFPWEEFEVPFKGLYSHTGRRAKPVRLMVSLLLLKQMYGLSDESVVEQWVTNPYYQYFSGEETFRWHLPCDPSDLVHFRHRIGETGVAKILQASINLHGKAAQEKCVIADTTVQEKNITYPTDLKLACKIIVKCRDIALRENIPLRQSYVRTVRKHLQAQRFKRNPKTYKSALRAGKKVRTIASRLLRELDRKLPAHRLAAHREEFALFKRVLDQKRADTNKVYSLHEPDVYCISKGKEHKKYEFGSKASFLVTKRGGIITGALSFDTNVFDAHTLEAAIKQHRELTGATLREVIADRGYRGVKTIGGTKISVPRNGKKGLTTYEKRKLREKFRRRSSIEPVIGHLKSDAGLGRNYLKGLQGDRINAMLAAAAFNIRKWMRIFSGAIEKFVYSVNVIFYQNEKLFLKLGF
jgi:IS5 family transposase